MCKGAVMDKSSMRTIHGLILIIKGLDPDKTRLSQETHDLIDRFEQQYAEMYEKDDKRG